MRGKVSRSVRVSFVGADGRYDMNVQIPDDQEGRERRNAAAGGECTMIKTFGLAAAMSALLVSISSAAATASLTCDADDTFISLHVQATLGHTGHFNAPRAEATIKSQGSAAKPLELEDEHLLQRWATGLDVRLRFFRDAPAYLVDLTIETRGKKDDENARPGIYRLEFTDTTPGKQPTTVKRTGRASCTIG